MDKKSKKRVDMTIKSTKNGVIISGEFSGNEDFFLNIMENFTMAVLNDKKTEDAIHTYVGLAAMFLVKIMELIEPKPKDNTTLN